MAALPAVLDVAIGVSLIFLTLSAICSSLNELIARFARLRAKYLAEGIATLLSDQNNDLCADVIRNPLIRRLGTDPRRFPDYIPSATFALALIDALRARAGGAAAMVARLQLQVQRVTDNTVKKQLQDALSTPDARQALEELRLAIASIEDPTVRASIAGYFSALEVNEIKQGIMALPDPRIQQVLLTLLNDTQTQIQRLEDVKQRLENWFNDGMDRVSVLYKHYVEWILRGLAVLVCFSFNADALHVVRNLWQDPTLRAALVAQAQVAAQTPPSTTAPTPGIIEQGQKVTQALDQLIGLPVGWNCNAYNDIFRAGWKPAETAPPSIAPGSYGFCEVIDGRPIVGGQFSFEALFGKLIGLLLMSIGVSFGAPFWFNLLTRIITLRPDKPKT